MNSKRLSVIGYPNLVIRGKKDHKHYYWRELVNGQRYEKTTKIHAACEVVVIDGQKMAKATRNINLAVQVAEKFKHQVIRDGCIKKDIFFNRLLDEVLLIQKNKSKRTFIIAQQSEKHLRPFFGAKSLKKFEDDFSVLWAKYVKNEKNKYPDRKLLHDCKFLVFCLRVAQQKKWVNRLFSRRDFPIPDRSRRVGQFVSENEVRKIIEEIKLIGDSKFLCQVVMALEMGMRKSEILGLRLDEVDILKKEIHLDPERVKTRKARQIPIPITRQAWMHLSPFIEKAQQINGKHIFPLERNTGHGVQNDGLRVDYDYDWERHQVEFPRYWDQLRKRLGTKIRFHDFRHTCVTNLILQGIPLPTISQFLGADMKILNEVYAHANDESKDLFRGALEGKYRF